jgi:hypothetical protein
MLASYRVLKERAKKRVKLNVTREELGTRAKDNVVKLTNNGETNSSY